MTSLHAPVSANDLVASALLHDRDRVIAIGEDGQRMTVGEFSDQVSRLEQLFATLRPAPTRAALLARNRLEVLSLNTAFGFAEIVLTALHPAGAVDDFLQVIEAAGIDLLVYDANHYSDVGAEIAARAPGLRHIFTVGAGEGDVIVAAAGFAPRRLVAPAPDPKALVRIAYSGGTTGKPKGIMVTQESSTTSTLTQLTSWEWPREMRHLVCAPLSHAGAAMLTPVLMNDGTMIVQGGFEPVATMRAIEEHRVTSILLVPTMVLALIDHPRFGEFDLSSLEIIYYGASAFPAARLRDAIDKLGPIFFQFYGQAEAPMSITVMRRDEHDINDPARLASCGRPTPLIRVALLDDDLNEVAIGEPGEVCVRGPLVMGGYLNMPDETAAAFQGGWLHTGDIAVRAPDGFLRIVDRKKDMIVTGGFNVFAREVEDVLIEHPGILQAAVIGVPDPKWGEAVTAVVVLRSGASATRDELIALVRERKGPIHAPKLVDFVDALPLSPLGKPDKKTLRRVYARTN